MNKHEIRLQLLLLAFDCYWLFKWLVKARTREARQEIKGIKVFLSTNRSTSESARMVLYVYSVSVGFLPEQQVSWRRDDNAESTGFCWPSLRCTRFAQERVSRDITCQTRRPGKYQSCEIECCENKERKKKKRIVAPTAYLSL